MQEIIVSNLGIVVQVIFAIVGALIIWLLKYLISKSKNSEAYAAAIEALRQGIDKVQEESVVWAKRAATDGKLTAEERAEARAKAIEYAKELAKGPGLKLLKTFGETELLSLIARLVEKKKEA